MGETNGNPTPDRLAELERENARLHLELAKVTGLLSIEQRIHDAYAWSSPRKVDSV